MKEKKILANSDEYLKRIETLKGKVKTQIQMDKIIELEEEFYKMLEKEKTENKGK